MSGLRILRAADRVAKPWKNGGGETADVLVRPEGAGLDDFAARVSIARVDGSGPFSVFPAIDRTLAILSGDGIELAVGDAPAVTLTAASAPHRFPGDEPTAARLLGASVTDLNVMTRRGAGDHRMRRINLTPGETATLDLADALLLWASGTGTIETPAGSLRPSPLDAIACALPGRWHLHADTAAVAYTVEFV